MCPITTAKKVIMANYTFNIKTYIVIETRDSQLEIVMLEGSSHQKVSDFLETTSHITNPHWKKNQKYQ